MPVSLVEETVPYMIQVNLCRLLFFLPTISGRLYQLSNLRILKQRCNKNSPGERWMEPPCWALGTRGERAVVVVGLSIGSAD